MNKKEIGLDRWQIRMQASSFLNLCKEQSIDVFDCTFKNSHISFYSPVFERMHIHHTFPDAVLLNTTGMLGYFFRSLKKPAFVISILLSIGLWMFLSQFVFSVEIHGKDSMCKKAIQDTMHSLDYNIPFSADESEIKKELKMRLSDKVAWLEVEKQGSSLHIAYTPKEHAQIKQTSRKQLYALKDGMIARFDIKHGEKIAKVNQIVHKGDLLVANSLSDSKGSLQELDVEGRVYAYTWKDVVVYAKPQDIKAFSYFEMLMEARREVTKDFHKEDEIIAENVLQFTKELGKIKMVIHYTMLQDITSP